MAARRRFEQRHQRREQCRVGRRHRVPPPTGTPDPLDRGGPLRGRQLQLGQARGDRGPRQPGGPRHERHATPARIARFRGRPLTAPALVQFDGDDLIFAPNPSHRLRVAHARVMTEFRPLYKRSL